MEWQEIRNLKKDTAKDFADFRSLSSVKPIRTSFHGVVIDWKCEDSNLLNSLIKDFPCQWLPSSGSASVPNYTVHWWQGKHDQVDFWEEANADCEQFVFGKKVCAVQRDFVAYKEGANAFLFTDLDETDSYHNFLRWLLPMEFLKRGSLLLHSSAVVNSRGEAFVCLGESGAGKTTIAEFAGRDNVLGDDMNLVSFSNGQCYVEPAAVGQTMQSSSLLGKRFPVKAFFTLEKASQFSLKNLSRSRGALALYAGVANLFLGQVLTERMIDLQALVSEMAQQSEFYQLSFNLDGEVWNHVFHS